MGDQAALMMCTIPSQRVSCGAHHHMQSSAQQSNNGFTKCSQVMIHASPRGASNTIGAQQMRTTAPSIFIGQQLSGSHSTFA